MHDRDHAEVQVGFSTSAGYCPASHMDRMSRVRAHLSQFKTRMQNRRLRFKKARTILHPGETRVNAILLVGMCAYGSFFQGCKKGNGGGQSRFISMNFCGPLISVADTRLYTLLCRLVGRSVGPSVTSF